MSATVTFDGRTFQIVDYVHMVVTLHQIDLEQHSVPSAGRGRGAMPRSAPTAA